VLDGGGWLTLCPGRFTPGKTRYPLYGKLGEPQGQSGWCENLASVGIRSPNRPARSKSLYQLSYPGLYSYAGERESLLQMEKQRFKKIHLKEKIESCNIYIWRWFYRNDVTNSQKNLFSVVTSLKINTVFWKPPASVTT
jgi:hypothetical protein